MTSRVSTSLNVSQGHYRVSVGDGNLTFSIDEHGNKSLLVPTRDLGTVADLFRLALTEWARAKQIEKVANMPVIPIEPSPANP